MKLHIDLREEGQICLHHHGRLGYSSETSSVGLEILQNHGNHCAVVMPMSEARRLRDALTEIIATQETTP